MSKYNTADRVLAYIISFHNCKAVDLINEDKNPIPLIESLKYILNSEIIEEDLSKTGEEILKMARRINLKKVLDIDDESLSNKELSEWIYVMTACNGILKCQDDLEE